MVRSRIDLSRALLYAGRWPSSVPSREFLASIAQTFSSQNRLIEELEKEARAILNLQQDEPILKFDFETLNDEQREAAHVIIHARMIKRYCESLEQKEIGEQIVLETIQLALAAVRGDFWSNLWPNIKRGAAAIHGSRLNRDDNLNKEIIRELKVHGLKQAALKILASLEKTISYDSVVYEITPSNSICWFDERGKARETGYHDFEKRVSKLRKRLRLLPTI